MKKALIFALAILGLCLFAGAATNPYYLRTSLYLDWYGATYPGSNFLNQISSRLKFEFSPSASRDWTVLIDLRDRYNVQEGSRNQFILYDARVTYNPQSKPLYFSVGQMNLYDTAGIGQLLGGVLGFKIKKDLLIGAYGGLQREFYINKIDTHYQKYGLFARYDGSGAMSLSLSYNRVRFSGSTEEEYLYAQVLVPVQKTVFVYGNIQYELGPHLAAKDRLSLVFLNARADVTRYADVTVYFSSGRGLDFHRYLLEKSQDPSLNDQELQRFFYSQQYGLRLSFKPVRDLKLYVSRQESEQKDFHLKDHTWRFGASLWNILKSGFSLYGDYSLNRGPLAESDSFYLSLSKEFGRFSWYATFSNTYNGFRYVAGAETPQIIHFTNYKTLGSSLFFHLNRRVSISLEYNYYLQEKLNQHLFFVRLILRK